MSRRTLESCVGLCLTVDDLNGISLVSDPITNETYLDVSDPLKVFSLMQQWKAANLPAQIKVSPQTYLTEISEHDVLEVARHEYFVPEGTPFDKYIPLDPYPAGDLGIRVENLKYLMKKVFDIAVKYTEAKMMTKTAGSQSITKATHTGSKKDFVSKTVIIGANASRQNINLKGGDPLVGIRALQEQRLEAQHKIYKGPPKTLIQDDPENSRDAEHSLNRSSYLGFTRTQITKKTSSLDPVIGGRIPKSQVLQQEPKYKLGSKVDYSLNKLIAQPNTLPSTMKQLFTDHQARALQEKHLHQQRMAEGILSDIRPPKPM